MPTSTVQSDRQTPRMARRFSPLRAAVALVVSVLCQLGQINASVHEIAVRHVICAEHGDMAHAGQSTGPASSESATPATPALQSDRSVSSHEHCPLPGILGRQATLPSAQQGPTPVAQLAAAPAHAGRSVAPGARLLLSAPKTSPPRV